LSSNPAMRASQGIHIGGGCKKQTPPAVLDHRGRGERETVA
jgi:hypothetical protein